MQLQSTLDIATFCNLVASLCSTADAVLATAYRILRVREAVENASLQRAEWRGLATRHIILASPKSMWPPRGGLSVLSAENRLYLCMIRWHGKTSYRVQAGSFMQQSLCIPHCLSNLCAWCQVQLMGIPLVDIKDNRMNFTACVLEFYHNLEAGSLFYVWSKSIHERGMKPGKSLETSEKLRNMFHLYGWWADCAISLRV